MKVFWRSLKIQFRVINALMMREIITRYGRENIGFLWLFVEPLILIVGVTIIWTYVVQRKEHGFPVATFIYTGWIANKLWLTTASRAMTGLQANLPLLYHRNIRPLDIYLSRIFLEITAITGVFILLGFVFYMSHVIDPPRSYFHIVLGWYLMCWLALGFSFFISSLNTLTNDTVQRIWAPVSLGFFIGSGTFFLVEWLPPEARSYILLLPSVHNLEMIRYGFFGGLMQPHYDVFYSVSFNLFLTLLGLFIFRYAIEKVQVE